MHTYTWKKYLPVIRLLIKKSATTEQTVTLNRTDFETNKLRKPSVSFSVEIVNGKMRTLNASAHAKDLLLILTQDSSTDALLRKRHFTISLNSDFQLTIKDVTPVPETPVEATDGEAIADGEGGIKEGE